MNTSDPIQHDPRTKSQIKEAIYQQLYDPMSNIMSDRLKSIVIRNTAAGKFSHTSFRYKGEIYKWGSEPVPFRSNPLLPQFVGEMESYLKDLKEINEKEIPYVLGYINQVLNSSNSLHDYLRLLPDSVHHPIKHMVDSCPCKELNLTEEAVQSLQNKNQDAILMMKHRMALNLII